ncbi:ATP synthase F0 subunit B [Hansschlegelia zhihuaiae]|uniref:PhnA-like protein n=1 Tax=Hansschlegelia zhihuaiae TaxID=405005 RepID=A0A4Q0M4R2_9HYPH|nr:ATP synthase F0 subunit B [Hansschlegelia zhihuaiae]RXF67947.1 hypothetical protein EK403_20700 [Hansschlegelia zhihuaiae]
MTDSTASIADRSGYVDWGAIFAGAVVAAGASLVLSTFASALGLGSVSVGKDGGVSTLGLILTGLFVAVSVVAVYMLGGYVAGRMRRRFGDAVADEVTARDGLHGLVVWGLGMLVAGSFAASAIGGVTRTVGSAAETTIQAAGSAAGGLAQGAGQLVGGAVSGTGQALGGAAQGAGGAAAPALQDLLPEGMRSNPVDYVIDQMVRPAEGGQGSAQPQDPAAAQRQVGEILMNLVRTGNIPDNDRAFLRNLVASRTGLNPEQVDARVNEAVSRAQELRAEAQKRIDDAKAEGERLKAEAQKRIADAKAQAEDAAETARIAGILTAFLLAASALVAAAAATIGAVWGGRHRDEGRIWKGLAYNK